MCMKVMGCSQACCLAPYPQRPLGCRSTRIVQTYVGHIPSPGQSYVVNASNSQLRGLRCAATARGLDGPITSSCA
jgi:hypothetical protein